MNRHYNLIEINANDPVWTIALNQSYFYAAFCITIQLVKKSLNHYAGSFVIIGLRQTFNLKMTTKELVKPNKPMPNGFFELAILILRVNAVLKLYNSLRLCRSQDFLLLFCPFISVKRCYSFSDLHLLDSNLNCTLYRSSKE